MSNLGRSLEPQTSKAEYNKLQYQDNHDEDTYNVLTTWDKVPVWAEKVDPYGNTCTPLLDAVVVTIM